MDNFNLNLIFCAIIFVCLIGFFIIAMFVAETINVRRAAKTALGDEADINNDEGALYAYRGLIAYYARDFRAAIEYFEKAIKFSYNEDNCVFCLGWMSDCYENLEDHDKALHCCLRAAQVAPRNIKAQFSAADRYCKKGQFEKAEFYYRNVLRCDEKNAAAAFMLGEVYMGRGEYGEAAELFKRSLAENVKFAYAFAELSVIGAINGDYKARNYYYRLAGKNKLDDIKNLKEKLRSIKRINEICAGTVDL